jgi:hypothetical protein
MFKLVLESSIQSFLDKWKSGSKAIFNTSSADHNGLIWAYYYKPIQSKQPIKLISSIGEIIVFRKGKLNRRRALLVYLNTDLIGGLYLDTNYRVVEADFNYFSFCETLCIDSKQFNKISCDRFTIQLTRSYKRFALLDIEYSDSGDEKLAIIIASFYYCRHVSET